MRFMMLVTSSEKAGMPPRELIDAIGKETAGAMADGTLVSSGGLLPSASATRVALRDGKITVTDGPFTETKELIGGFAIFQLNSKQEAVDSARHFMELHQQYWPNWHGATEVRQMYEPDEFPCD
jgi:hypothetical protein